VSFRASWSYPHGDPSIHLFDEAVQRWDLPLRPGAKVLELGCCETDFRVWIEAAGCEWTGVDARDCPECHAPRFVVGSASDGALFPEATFDAVVFLGSLEHFGLGYYHDPVGEAFDIQAVENAARWVVPGGWVYYDVPWTPGEGYTTDNRHFRVYDDAQLNARLTSTLVPQTRAYAHGETAVWQDARPSAPASPFWYVQRLLRRPA
jgi:hypothetical protein